MKDPQSTTNPGPVEVSASPIDSAAAAATTIGSRPAAQGTAEEAPQKRARSTEPMDKASAPAADSAAAAAANPDGVLQVLRVHEAAKLPKRGTVHSAGFDLSASEATTIAPGGRGVVKTGLKIKVPAGCYGRVAPRSGLAVKKGIDVGAGVIDADYRGEVGVVLFNFGTEPYVVDVGERVAQLVLEKVCMADVLEVEGLDETERGAGGFGSTGAMAK